MIKIRGGGIGGLRGEKKVANSQQVGEQMD